MSTPTALALACPRCGSATPIGGGARIVDCRSCGGRSVLPLRPPCPSYHVEPELTSERAAEAVRAFLDSAAHGGDVATHAQLATPRLYFMPYHHVTGRRLGVIRALVPHVVRDLDELTGTRYRHSAARDRTRPELEIVERADTRVLLADLDAMVPAFGGRRWDLVAFQAAAARLAAVLHPFDRAALQRRGIVFSVAVPADGAELRATKADNVARVVGVQRRTIYFPFWLVPLRYRGGHYEALLAAAGTPGAVVWAYTPAGAAAPLEARAAVVAAGLLLGFGLKHAAGSVAAGASLAAVVSAGDVVAAALALGAFGVLGLWAWLRRRRPPSYEWRGPHAQPR